MLKRTLKTSIPAWVGLLLFLSLCAFVSDVPVGEGVVRFMFENGRKLSPSYKAADCSTLMTKTMNRFFTLSVAERRQINISFATPLEEKEFKRYFKIKSDLCIKYNQSIVPYGQDAWIAPLDLKRYGVKEPECLCPVYAPNYILEQEKRLSGIAGFIESRGGQKVPSINKAQKGDFIQFWYPNSWGHCGVVQSVDTLKGTMLLHSSFPSTDGYGIQTFGYDAKTIIYLARLGRKGA